MRSPAVSSMSSSRPAGRGATCAGQVHQLIRGIAHGGDHDDHLVAGFARLDNALGDALDAFRVCNGGATVLLYDQRHVCLPRILLAKGSNDSTGSGSGSPACDGSPASARCSGSVLDQSAAFEGPAKGHFVRIFEVAADGQPGGEARHAQLHVLSKRER